MADIIDLTERLQDINSKQLDLGQQNFENSQLALDINTKNYDVLEFISDKISSIESTVVNMFDWQKDQRALELDMMREKKDAGKATGAVAGTDLFSSLKDIKMDSSWLSKLLIPALAAWALDLENFVRVSLLPKTIGHFKNIAKTIGTLADDVIKVAKTAFKPMMNVLEVFKSAPAPEAVGPKKPGLMTRAAGAIKSPFTSGTGPMKFIGDTIKSVSDSIKDIFDGIKNTFSKIKTYFGTIKESISKGKELGNFLENLIKPIKSFFTVVRTVVSKILLPLQVLFSLFDFVQGFIEGFKTQGEEDTRGMMEKIFDGIIGGFREMITSFFGGILDLLKDLVGWIAEKLGFDQFSEMLDSFSFEEWFKSIWDGFQQILSGIKDFFVGLFTGDTDKIMEGFGKIADVIQPIIASIVNGIISGLQLLVSKLPWGGDKLSKMLEGAKMDTAGAGSAPDTPAPDTSGAAAEQLIAESPTLGKYGTSEMYSGEDPMLQGLTSEQADAVSRNKDPKMQKKMAAAYKKGNQMKERSLSEQAAPAQTPQSVSGSTIGENANAGGGGNAVVAPVIAPQNNSVNNSSVTNVKNVSQAAPARVDPSSMVW